MDRFPTDSSLFLTFLALDFFGAARFSSFARFFLELITCQGKALRKRIFLTCTRTPE